MESSSPIERQGVLVLMVGAQLGRGGLMVLWWSLRPPAPEVVRPVRFASGRARTRASCTRPSAPIAPAHVAVEDGMADGRLGLVAVVSPWVPILLTAP